MQLKRFLLSFLVFCPFAFAIKNVAILEVVSSKSVTDAISIEESKHLTDELRRQAIILLPRNDFSVLTRENIVSLLPPDEEERECLSESCIIEIGRAIGAEYVGQGTVGKFGEEFTISIELYETLTGKLISSMIFESQNLSDLLKFVREESHTLFQAILDSQPKEEVPINIVEAPIEETPVTEVPIEEIPAVEAPIVIDSIDAMPLYSPEKDIAIEDEKKRIKSDMVWGTISYLGAAAFFYAGFMANSSVNDRYDEYKSMNNRHSKSDFNDKWDEVEDAKTNRNIFYALGFVFTGLGYWLWL